ncbi:unnamed protein product [Penicillium glandicola]
MGYFGEILERESTGSREIAAPSQHAFSSPVDFTHGDLTNCNIMVDPASFELSALIDWEGSGYLPVWWEYTGAGFGFGQDGIEWKRLLLANMANHKEARTWSFVSHSSDSETRLKLPKECGIEKDIEI